MGPSCWPVHTWITARMTHVYALGSLLGLPGCGALAAQALSGLQGPLHDDDHGGWHPNVGDDGPAPDKSCYDHTFVVLAASTAVLAGLDGADDLYHEAVTTLIDRFWDDEVGLCVDRWDTTFTHLDPYRGLNANMHALEAMLAAASLDHQITSIDQEGVWLEAAHRIARFVIGVAGANQWRVPEHYDRQWTPQLDLNRDRPADQFKPYGATPGHGFEWARLLIHLANAPHPDGPGTGAPHPDGPHPDGTAPGGACSQVELVEAAQALFARAAADGWWADGRPGFVYTTDWDGAPVVADRFHWVAAEAIGAAAALHTGDEVYAHHYRRWWDHAATALIDPEHGSWHHQLDPHNQPAETVWAGKPDIYHAFQATLIPRLPLYPMLGAAILSGAGS